MHLFVSKGPEAWVLPKDLAGQSEAGARQILRDLGFEIGSVSRVNNPSIPTDWVVGTEPNLGKKVKVGTKIDLVLSTGMVDVPQLINLTVPEATAMLDELNAGLRISEVEEIDAAAKPGTIINQVPESGSTSPQGGTVTVTVAIAPADPTPADTPSASPSGTPGGPQEPPATQTPPSGSPTPGGTPTPPAHGTPTGRRIRDFPGFGGLSYFRARQERPGRRLGASVSI